MTSRLSLTTIKDRMTKAIDNGNIPVILLNLPKNSTEIYACLKANKDDDFIKKELKKSFYIRDVKTVYTEDEYDLDPGRPKNRDNYTGRVEYDSDVRHALSDDTIESLLEAIKKTAVLYSGKAGDVSKVSSHYFYFITKNPDANNDFELLDQIPLALTGSYISISQNSYNKGAGHSFGVSSGNSYPDMDELLRCLRKCKFVDVFGKELDYKERKSDRGPEYVCNTFNAGELNNKLIDVLTLIDENLIEGCLRVMLGDPEDDFDDKHILELDNISIKPFINNFKKIEGPDAISAKKYLSNGFYDLVNRKPQFSFCIDKFKKSMLEEYRKYYNQFFNDSGSRGVFISAKTYKNKVKENKVETGEIDGWRVFINMFNQIYFKDNPKSQVYSYTANVTGSQKDITRFTKICGLPEDKINAAYEYRVIPEVATSRSEPIKQLVEAREAGKPLSNRSLFIQRTLKNFYTRFAKFENCNVLYAGSYNLVAYLGDNLTQRVRIGSTFAEPVMMFFTERSGSNMEYDNYFDDYDENQDYSQDSGSHNMYDDQFNDSEEDEETEKN